MVEKYSFWHGLSLIKVKQFEVTVLICHESSSWRVTDLSFFFTANIHVLLFLSHKCINSETDSLYLCDDKFIMSVASCFLYCFTVINCWRKGKLGLFGRQIADMEWQLQAPGIFFFFCQKYLSDTRHTGLRAYETLIWWNSVRGANWIYTYRNGLSITIHFSRAFTGIRGSTPSKFSKARPSRSAASVIIALECTR